MASNKDKDNFKNIIGNCPNGQHWVRAYHQSSYTKTDGTAVSGSHHPAGCRSNPPSYAVWSKKLKSGSPLSWEIKSEKVKPWLDAEKDRVFESLSELPMILLTESITGIYRMAESRLYKKNPAAGFNHQITLYDEAFSDGSNLTRILAHEFAHEVFFQMPVFSRIEYAKAAEWTTKEVLPGKFIPVPRRVNYVEEDGRNSIDEDFSNNIEYFLFNRVVLKTKSPKVYDWILKKFGDKLMMGVKNK